MAQLQCFVIHPFAQEFDAVYRTVRDAVRDAIPGEQIACYSLKDVHGAGRITDDIVTSIRDSALCVADVTGSNPNVMWETGYAMALGKPTILIAEDVDELPFDLQVHRAHEYGHGDLNAFADLLRAAVQQTMSDHDLRSASLEQAKPLRRARTIAVTGSMQADRARVGRRADELLSPYVSTDVQWLTGSAGTSDEIVIEHLLRCGERVTAVGYHRFDSSYRIRQLIGTGQIGFIDASLEELPRNVLGPTMRDVLFCTKSDLVILLWDGRSEGTRRLARFLKESGRSTLIAFA